MTRAFLLTIVTLAGCAAPAAPEAEGDGWVSLFNGTDLSGWDTYIGPELSETGETLPGPPLGLNSDPDGVFSVVEVDGAPAVRISGERGGGLSTVEAYGDYHLRLQFRWGEAMPWPFKDLRDSGLLYHAVGPHGVDWGFWMRSQEFQIQEGDTGDYWGVAGGIVDVPARRTEAGDYVYDPGGPLTTFRDGTEVGRHCVKDPGAERPTGAWNTLELYAVGGTSVHVVNGVVTMVLSNSRQPEGEGTAPLTRGKLQIQSEGAEVFFRDLEIRPVDRIPPRLLPG